jgi:hypothetical protein
MRALVSCLAVAVVVASALVAAGPSGAAGTAKPTKARLVIYSLAVSEEFNDHSDDRQRGGANNPFGNFQGSQSATREAGAGPFAGDRAIFVFKLYSDAGLAKSIGTATFACEYGFAKQGMCKAVYELKGGSLLGVGLVNFNSPTFQIAVSGGSGKYQDALGDLQASPSQKKANKLVITLV